MSLITWILVLLVFGSAFNGYSWKVTVAIAGLFSAGVLAHAHFYTSGVKLEGALLVIAAFTLISLAVHVVTRLICRYAAWRDARLTEGRAPRP